MFLQVLPDGRERIMTSASDLTAASMCEFAFLRRVDARLGREVAVPPDDDPMLARAARLGDAHEDRVLEEYRVDLGAGEVGQPGGVVEIARCDPRREEELAAAAGDTVAALIGGADIVFQATFFDPQQSVGLDAQPDIGFLGFADFLQRIPGGAYEVQDTKLARRAKVTALMQLAAYAEQLERVGVRASSDAVLILGDGARSRHRITDVAPVFRARRARLHQQLRERVAAVGDDGRRESADVVTWGALEVEACGRCEVCTPEIERTRDPLLIAGIRRTQRDALIAAGCPTIDAVASLDISQRAPDTPAAEIAGLAAGIVARIAAQAAVQVESSQRDAPVFRVANVAALAAIPAPDDGDLFFDFEGDPMYREPGATDRARWGLDYLFGVVDREQAFTPIWAHDLDAEKHALTRFLELVEQRRQRYPGMHIYHYAAYERTHLLSIAARHGVGEAAVDRLLREHVLVDLYPIVRAALRVGSRSYSIKKLEPLYMGDELRDQDGVTNGAESVTEYAEASAQLTSRDVAVRDVGQRRLDAIADYNRYDCVSTLRLRDWLWGLASQRGVAPLPAPVPLDDVKLARFEPSRVAGRLQERAAEMPDGPDRTAVALAAAAVDYHEREQKSFWWAHYARLIDPIEEWADTRDVVVVDPTRTRVIEPWHVPDTPRARAVRRHLLLRGQVAPGSSLKAGSEVYVLYAHPAPFAQPGAAPGARGVRQVKIIERVDDGVLVEESLRHDEAFSDLPIAVTPGSPPRAGAQKTAIEEWGTRLADSLEQGGEGSGEVAGEGSGEGSGELDNVGEASGTPHFPADPVVDLLRRSAPRLRGGAGLVDPASPAALAAAGGDEDARVIGAVIASLLQLDRSALAVQGPPGTGKTYLAARVIRRLVEQHGWRIGVVAQSHRVVENVLDGVVGAGLDSGLVAKVAQRGADPEHIESARYTVLPANGHARFIETHASSGQGCVIGGTAWDFSNETRLARGALDLLVIDEAGQFSLAPTIAASVAAERLLLLGDPQQLPQVSQGSHPEPVDESALGWLLGEHGTIPAALGYFLAETRRMRPELTEVVSELSYEGRLRAHQSAAERWVEEAGPPGLVWHPVRHHGNATHSVAEAQLVAELAERLLSGQLSPAGETRRPLTPDDLIVVAPYNAHVECVEAALDAVGLGRIRVGTVDRFQGQEAAIAIVTLAASSPDDVPRGLEFLLMRNRLNVGISRAQWAAHLVSSDRLGEGLPTSAEGLVALSGYLKLLECAEHWSLHGE